MTAARTVPDHDPVRPGTGYINATSTCDCTLRAGFAVEPVRMLMGAGVKIAPDQRLVA
jgi:hypothetical protein